MKTTRRNTTIVVLNPLTMQVVEVIPVVETSVDVEEFMASITSGTPTITYADGVDVR